MHLFLLEKWPRRLPNDEYTVKTNIFLKTPQMNLWNLLRFQVPGL